MKPSLHLDLRIRRADRLQAGQVDDEVVMIDIDSGKYYGLDPIGSFIWNHLATPIRIADLCTLLGQRYTVEAERCQREVLALLEQMQERDMLIVVE